MSVLRDLRALSRREATEDDIVEFNRQLELESNDRGAALLQATNLDIALTQAIYEVLSVSDDLKETLDKPGAPLETFSQRIIMGHVLRLYGGDTEYNLTLVRLLRNAFAHAHVPITFETKEIAAAVGLFRDVPVLPPFPLGYDKQPIPTQPRARFHRFCGVLTHNLILGGKYGKRRVPV
jgi:hypothetical protein